MPFFFVYYFVSGAAANARLMARLGLSAPAVSETGTVVHIAIDGRLTNLRNS